MSFPFSFVYSWCCCFDANVDEDEGFSKEHRANNGHGSESQKDTGHPITNATSNGQMQPIIPPLPELRPLEPLEPFGDMKRSLDDDESTDGITLKGKEGDNRSAVKS